MTDDSPPSLLVTLCTYNERDNLDPLVAEIHRHAQDAHVLVVDDNSPDGTGELADRLAAGDPRIHVLHRAGKQGLGTATLAGFRYGVDQGYDRLLNMDADFSHHPRYIPALREAVDEGADVAIGSRYVAGGGVEGWGPGRHFMSRSINLYTRCLLGIPARDTSGSFRCYRTDALRRIDFGAIRARGYAFQQEILFRCRRAGCRFAEVPIVFEDRRHGESKIDWRESVAALWIILRLGLQRLGTPVVSGSER